MTTSTLTKVNTKWDQKRTQQTSAYIVASTFVAAFEVLSKFGPKALEEFDTLLRKSKIEHYKALGVKTPIELVRAISDSEHNVFGSEIEISGDDRHAVLKYNSCGLWSEMQKQGKFTAEQEKIMGEQCVASWTQIAREFGLKYEAKCGEDMYEMHFSK